MSNLLLHVVSPICPDNIWEEHPGPPRQTGASMPERRIISRKLFSIRHPKATTPPTSADVVAHKRQPRQSMRIWQRSECTWRSTTARILIPWWRRLWSAPLSSGLPQLWANGHGATPRDVS